MKFNGDFVVTKRIDAKDLVVTQNADLKSTDVEGSLTVTGEVNLQDNAAFNTFDGKDDNALANQKYIKEQTTDVILREPDMLEASDGKNGDIAFEGRLYDIEGGFAEVTPEQKRATFVVDMGNGEYLHRFSNNANPASVARSTDGKNWTPETWQLPAKQYNGPILYTNGVLGWCMACPGYLSRGDSAKSPYITTDNGKSWSKSNHDMTGSFTTAAASGNNAVIAGAYRTAWSTNGGINFQSGQAYDGYNALSNSPNRDMRLKSIRGIAMQGANVVLINDKYDIWVSYNGGWRFTRRATLNRSQSSKPSIEFYSDKLYLSGGNSGELFTSDLFAGTTEVPFPDDTQTAQYRSISHIGVNRRTKRVVVVVFIGGSSPELRAYAADIPDSGHITTLTRIPSDIDGIDVRLYEGYTHTYDQYTLGVAATSGKYVYLSIDDEATFMTARQPAIKSRLMNLYTKYNNKWLKYTPDATSIGDTRYAPIAGGEIGELTLTDNLDLAGHKLTGIPTPTTGTDIVNKEYVDNLISGSAGGAIDATIGTASTTIDTTPGTIETMVYSISAKHSSGRYYSRVNVTADGNTNPTSAEYAVLTIGDLDLTIDVEKAGDGSTLLKAKSNKSSTEIRVKREIIDV